jgi:4-hydroxybenzoyl-CoA thioesterase
MALLMIDISFGDCDPAGIVFYPNAFRWMDAAFHHHLRGYGGHSHICETLGAVGLGLVDASAKFRKPMRDGDRLELSLEISEWTTRSFTLLYKGTVEGANTFTGHEVRCLFTRSDAGIAAGEISALKALLE